MFDLQVLETHTMPPPGLQVHFSVHLSVSHVSFTCTHKAEKCLLLPRCFCFVVAVVVVAQSQVDCKNSSCEVTVKGLEKVHLYI